MSSENPVKSRFDEPPKIGYKIPLNHSFPIQSKQIFKFRPNQVLDLLPLSARYAKYYACKKMHKRKPYMDYFAMVNAGRMYGCPIGGIGGGTIGRGFKGEFCRWQLTPGIYQYVTVPECQFIVNIRNADNVTIFQSVLSTYTKPKKAPATWEWNIDGAKCEYTGLYPRAWTTYDLSQYGVKLTCRQISPVIPNNYKDSSLPCAVFVWHVTNVGAEHRTVSIAFTWTELVTNTKKSKEKLEIERYSEEHTSGVSLEQKINDVPCTFTIAKTKQEHETIHEGYCIFNTAKESSYVWECLKEHGRLQPETKPLPQGNAVSFSDKNKPVLRKSLRCDGIGLSSSISLDPGGSGDLEYCLAWDMPVVQFKKNSKSYKRYYTRYFGSEGIAGASIAAYALTNYERWEELIYNWQEPILSSSIIPETIKSALMNELYFVADGGTVWFDVQDDYPDTDPRHTYGLFAYLEGHEYRMYNTYDVHFYASFALAQLWPNLQVVIQYMFRDTIAEESADSRSNLYNGKTVKRKSKQSIPHDLGDPDDDPFTIINTYNIHDVSEWRDLNAKYILQVMRDYSLLRARAAPLGADRYRSLEFIDDVRDGTEGDLYLRSTGQTIPDRPPKRVRIASHTEPQPPVHKPIQTEELEPNATGNILEMLYRTESKDSIVNDRSMKSGGGDTCEAASAGVWGAERYLADLYESCEGLVNRMMAWDKDGDGLIENSGEPDQTFDAWVMTGPSAYCGSLWLATLFSMKRMSEILKKGEEAAQYELLLQRARAAFDEKLWTGTHYRFDTKPSNAHVIMADQLAGHWYLRASGFSHEVLSSERVQSCLRTVYANNVLKFRDGRTGAVNGFIAADETRGRPGKVDRTAMQSEEMWTGVTYGLAALMIHEGMHEEAFKMSGSMYTTLSDMGLAYETPEAIFENGNHRSVGYMRPLAVWAIHLALIHNPPIQQTKANGHVDTKDDL